MKKLLSILAFGACAFPAFAQWNNNTAVNLQINNIGVEDMQTASTPDGKTWVAYYAKRGGTPLRFDMYAQLLDTAGNKMLGPNGVLVDTNASTTAIFVFNVCAAGKNDFIIGMQDARSGSMATVAYKIDINGNSVWNGGNGVVLGDGYSPYPTELASGEVVFAWSANSGKLNYQKISPTGVPAWATPKVFAGNSRRGQMVPMSDSGFVMVYQQPLGAVNSKPYVQRFKNNGDSVWTSSVLLNTTGETTSSARYYSILHDNDTTYFGYYSSPITNHFNAWVQRINPDGTVPYGGNGAAVSDYSINSEPNEQTTNIGLQPNSNYVWAATTFGVTSPVQQSGVMVQKFDKTTGQRLLNPYGKVVYPMTADLYSQQSKVTFKKQYPVFMVASLWNYLIKATVLNDTGSFLLPAQDFLLSSTFVPQPTSVTKGRFAFTEMLRGQSVAVWTEKRDTIYRGYAQNFRLDMLDTSIAVKTVNNVPAIINTYHGLLNMTSALLPAAALQDVTWSLVPGTGTASISTTGVVTAITEGTVWAKATSNIAAVYVDSMQITITNQADTTTPSGISDIEQRIGFNAYPNPTNSVLNLHIGANHPALNLSIVDLNGRVVYLEKVTANALNNTKTINLKALASGTYILEVKGDGLLIHKKFAKE